MEFLPLLYNFLYFNHEIFDIYKVIWFWSDKCILETCHFLVSLFDFKNPQISWFIWQYISGWRFLHKSKSLRLVLGSVYLERFWSQAWFSIREVYVPLHWISFLFFIPKKSKSIDFFCLGLIFTLFKFILSVAP